MQNLRDVFRVSKEKSVRRGRGGISTSVIAARFGTVIQGFFQVLPAHKVSFALFDAALRRFFQTPQ